MDQQLAPTNADLYRAGKKYLETKARLAAGGKRRATWQTVAAATGTARTAVVDAARFADAVDRIAANCGGTAEALLLSDHPKLPARVVKQIGRVHADRQRYALGQVRAGRNPFGKPPDGVDPPFDTHGYPEVLGRLARNAGLLDHVADGLLATPRRDWPDAGRRDDILRDAGLILADCRLIGGRMKEAGGRLAEERGDAPRRPGASVKPFDPATAGWKVASVRGITRKNARELPRVIRETPPTRAEVDAVLEGVRNLRRSAERLAAMIRARGHDPRTGPSEVPGTYVVFLHLPRAAPGLTIGDLGTFDFPPGFYAYLGSAFGPGGVRKRTHRHLTRRSDRPRWNVDHLKPLCTPVAVWWTHDRRKVEFDWAGLLASLPGADFPADKFGAADNRSAKAHLVRFDRMPSFTMFRRRVRDAMTGHAPVYERMVRDWTGCGWPG